MESTTDNILALWLAQLDERIGWLEQAAPDMTGAQLAQTLAELDNRMKALGVVIHDVKNFLANHVEADGGTEAAYDTPTGTVLAERHVHVRRTGIDREALVADFMKAAKNTPLIDTETGEIIGGAEALLAHVQTAFRLEPRWAEIKKAGLDADEYCRSEVALSVKARIVGGA